jgi:serine/threonine-protein kinase
MGEVWRAYDTTIKRVVALKLLPPSFADDPVFQERFRREAHAAAGLTSPTWCQFMISARSTVSCM